MSIPPRCREINSTRIRLPNRRESEVFQFRSKGNINPRPTRAVEAGVNRRGGRRSRDKGNRAERAIVRFFQDHGFAAERVPLSGAAGGSYVGDLTVPIVGRDLRVEVKVRSAGFGQLYAWLNARDVLIVRADRREPLVVVPLRLAAEIATAANRGKVAS
jgi:hypothetical protein